MMMSNSYTAIENVINNTDYINDNIKCCSI